MIIRMLNPYNCYRRGEGRGAVRWKYNILEHIEPYVETFFEVTYIYKRSHIETHLHTHKHTHTHTNTRTYTIHTHTHTYTN